MEQLETRAVMATVSLGDVVPLAEGFGFGSTIAGLGRAFDATTPDQFTLISFKNNGSAIADAGRFTVEAWVYPKPGQSKGVIWTMGGTYGLSLVNETGLQFQMGRAAVFERNDVNINLTIPKVLNPDAWNHVAVTYDGDRARIYVNGVDVGSSTPFNPDPTPLKLYGILSSSVSSTVNLDIPSVSAGAIDELRIWTTVRTPAEIQETMLTPLAGTEPGLIGYWNFDNPSPDSPDRELDSSPSGNSLFMTKPKYILNASPQVGYVDVVVSEPVTDVKGLWVAYDVVSGSATEEVDFSGAAFRKVSDQPTTERNGIIIPKGATRGRVYFVARPDAISESTESFDVKLANYSFSGASASDYVIAAPSQKTVSIVDSGAYQKNVGLVDSFGRAVTAATKLFVDPVTRNATFSVQLTSEPDFAAPQEDVVFLELSATNAAVDDGRGAAQSLTLRFTPANWDVPRKFTLTGVTADGTISLNDRTQAAVWAIRQGIA